MLSEVFAWALRCGAIRVAVAVLSPEREVPSRAGLTVSNRRGDFTGPFNTAVAAELLTLHVPERLWLWDEKGRLLVYVHETWDSVVVQGTELEVDDLRSRL